MPVTSHDVARAAGVSQPTVSRALRPDSQVSAATREKVRAAADALGYVPSELGRSLSTRSTRQIAMVTDLDNALYPHLLAPLHDALAEHGYRMVLLAEREDQLSSESRLVDGSVDGAVLTTSQVRSPLPDHLRARRLPFVQLNRVSELADSDSVTADNAGGGRLVATLLAELGHRRVGAILGPKETSSARERERGFRAGLRAAGLRLPAELVARGWFTYADGDAGMRRLMSVAPPPTAVFCINDTVAVGAMNALADLGVPVPRDVSVIGFDDLDIAGWPLFRLTTVAVDFSAMARRAADLLLARIGRSPTGYTHERLEVSMVLRSTHRSTGDAR